MLRELFRFEVRYHLRQPLFWIVTLVFGVLTFGAVSSDAVSIGGGIGNVHRNAPTVILQLLGVMSALGVFVVTAYVASAAQRDFEHGTHELFFSKPIGRTDYVLGRFAGSLLVAFLVFVGTTLGILLGSAMPWLEADRLGPFHPGAYAFGLFVIVLPNLFFTGALFSLLAHRTRSLLGTYLGVVGFLALYFTASVVVSDLENRTLGALTDPFGISAVELATRYWTVVESNSQVPALAGPLLWNRLIWTAVGALVFAADLLLFRPVTATRGSARRRRRAAAAEAEAMLPALGGGIALPAVSRRFGRGTAWRQFLHQTRLEVFGVLRSVPFLVLLAFGMFNVVGGSQFLDDMFGTSVYPVTHLMLQLLAGSFVFLLLVIVTFYAGELIWRERSLRLAEVHDALPVPNWVPLLSKLVALVSVVVAFLVVGGLTTTAIQLARGYTHLEPGLYALGLTLAVAPFVLGCVLAVFLQVIANGKFLGYLLMILWIISEVVLGALHYQHNLYRYGGLPDAPYSDMNGYGHFLVAVGWYTLYWSAGASILLLLAHLFWVRGTGHTWRDRLRLARARLGRPERLGLAAAAAAFLATGGWIFYNTTVLNSYQPQDEQYRRQAEYEKKYRRDLAAPLPRIVAVDTEVDLFPEARRAEVRGRYRLVNRNAATLERLRVTTNPRVHTRLELPPHRVETDDRELGYAVYRLERPLAPGAELELPFTVVIENPGFVNGDSDTRLVHQGSFFNSADYMPMLSYDSSRELRDRNERRKHGLPPVIRQPKIDDVGEHAYNYVARDGDWVDFATTVSTSADQVALAPGYLQREWRAGGRRYFRYAMDAPILHFQAYLSARWEITRDRWKGPGAPPGGVAIEIYHLPTHAYDVQRMVDGAKASLDYFTASFGPYQHRQVRIVEFPRYARFAQSFPNTIPFSESIGFIADLRDPEAIDYVFYVTAHEVAHQWWAHQVMGANVQGATMLSETLSQYSALMVMEKTYGKESMRRFLKYELDRYLSERGGELVEELPLYLVEDQPYIHYRKGSVVMYALRDAIGEEAVNRALRRLVEAHRFGGPPYPDSRELVALLREETPADKQGFLTDLLERITLFSNRAVAAEATRRADGKWVVDLMLEAKKLYADGEGRETRAPLDAWVDVGVFGPKPEEKGKPEPILYLAKHHLTKEETHLQLVVDSEPAEAGIDPFNKLVDRVSDDNRREVKVRSSPG